MYKIFDFIEDPMKLALDLAKNSKNKYEVPVGCVIVNKKKELISCASNESIQKNDPIGHAEIIAIRQACKRIKKRHLNEMYLYVTLQPCIMCEAAIYITQIQKVFFGCYNKNFKDIFFRNREKYSSDKTVFQYYGGFLEEECSNLLKNFFNELRNK